MLRALLVQRFKLETHIETRPVSLFTLTAVETETPEGGSFGSQRMQGGHWSRRQRPKDRESDSEPAGVMPQHDQAQLAERFRNIGPGYLESSRWRAPGSKAATASPLALPEPCIAGRVGATGALSLFDAVNKQLGLKLELQKRPMPVLVIDHVEEKPTDN
jgi:hypothetical protein